MNTLQRSAVNEWTQTFISQLNAKGITARQRSPQSFSIETRLSKEAIAEHLQTTSLPFTVDLQEADSNGIIRGDVTLQGLQEANE